MKGENQPLVIDELVEFEEKLVEKLKTSRKLPIIFRGIYRIYANFNKETKRCQHVTD
jgi:hypothetical protein